jgi:hypothetical protein
MRCAMHFVGTPKRFISPIDSATAFVNVIVIQAYTFSHCAIKYLCCTRQLSGRVTVPQTGKVGRHSCARTRRTRQLALFGP